MAVITGLFVNKNVPNDVTCPGLQETVTNKKLKIFTQYGIYAMDKKTVFTIVLVFAFTGSYFTVRDNIIIDTNAYKQADVQVV